MKYVLMPMKKVMFCLGYSDHQSLVLREDYVDNWTIENTWLIGYKDIKGVIIPPNWLTNYVAGFADLAYFPNGTSTMTGEW